MYHQDLFFFWLPLFWFLFWLLFFGFCFFSFGRFLLLFGIRLYFRFCFFKDILNMVFYRLTQVRDNLTLSQGDDGHFSLLLLLGALHLILVFLLRLFSVDGSLSFYLLSLPCFLVFKLVVKPTYLLFFIFFGFTQFSCCSM